MTHTEAKQIIDVLARGIDPETGEVLPPDSALNSPHVIRALFLAAQALEQQAANPASKAKTWAAKQVDKPGNAGAAWSVEESNRLAAAFDAGGDVAQLARDHQRSTGAIRSRLIRLGRLQPVDKTSPK